MDRKLLFNGKLYILKNSEAKKLLDVTHKYTPENSIFALDGFGITEVINKSYKSKSSLKRAIMQFESEGFKVYYKEQGKNG